MHGGARGSGGQPGNQNATKRGDYSARQPRHDFIVAALFFMLDGDRRRCRRVLRTELERRHAVAYCQRLMPEIAPDLAKLLGVSYPLSPDAART